MTDELSDRSSPPERGIHGCLHAQDLAVTYGPLVALHDVNLVLDPGTLLAVTGPSGAGKSTLLWALAGAVQPSMGGIGLGDTLITTRQQAATLGVAIVPQGNALAGALTAAENILVPLLTAGVPVTEAQARTDAALTAVHLTDSGQHLIEELSGGQQQRVAVARTLAMHPQVLLADECTSDLDAISRDQVIALLRDQALAGAIVVMTTHDAESAAQADAELALDQGAMTWARHL